MSVGPEDVDQFQQQRESVAGPETVDGDSLDPHGAVLISRFPVREVRPLYWDASGVRQSVRPDTHLCELSSSLQGKHLRVLVVRE